MRSPYLLCSNRLAICDRDFQLKRIRSYAVYSVKKRVAVSPKNDNLSCAVDFNKTNLHDQNLGHSLKIVSCADNWYGILAGVLVSANS